MRVDILEIPTLFKYISMIFFFSQSILQSLISSLINILESCINRQKYIHYRNVLFLYFVNLNEMHRPRKIAFRFYITVETLVF